MSSNSTLWMGDIETWMDENYVKKIFALIAPLKSIKVMKKNGQSIGYGFIEFETEDIATYVLNNFNGKIINGNNKPLKLSRAQFSLAKLGEEEVQIYICDMDINVTEDMLFEFFKNKFPSVFAAKLICDSNRISKGYGFIKMRSMEEANKAVKEMNGKYLLGKPIRVK